MQHKYRYMVIQAMCRFLCFFSSTSGWFDLNILRHTTTWNVILYNLCHHGHHLWIFDIFFVIHGFSLFTYCAFHVPLNVLLKTKHNIRYNRCIIFIFEYNLTMMWFCSMSRYLSKYSMYRWYIYRCDGVSVIWTKPKLVHNEYMKTTTSLTRRASQIVI